MYNDPSNQAVNIFTRLADFALKTIGTVTKHVTAAFYAVYRDHRNGDNLRSGKISVKKLLKSSSECRMFTLEGNQAIKKFKKIGKQYHIPYSSQKQKENNKKIFNITIRGEDVSRIKYLLGENLEFLNVAKQGKDGGKLKGGVVKLDDLLKSSKECRMFTIEGTEKMKKFEDYAKEKGIPFAVKKHTQDGKTYYNMSIRSEDVAVTKYVMGDKLNFMKLEEQGEISKKSKKENPSKNNSKEQDSKDINKTKTSETIERLKDYKDKIDKGDIPADKTVDIDIGKDMDIDLPSKD